MSEPKKRRAKALPPDVLVLKGLVQTQAEEIASLKASMASKEAMLETHRNATRAAQEEVSKAKNEIEEVHSLIDQCEGAMGRMRTVKQLYCADREVENTLMLRLASWLAATKKA